MRVRVKNGNITERHKTMSSAADTIFHFTENIQASIDQI